MSGEDARREAVRFWRDFATDPARHADIQRHAHDLLSDHFDHVGHDDLNELEDGEREAYLAYLADSLATGLLRFVGYWLLNDYPDVAEWRGRVQ